ncbi:LysR substrate binding domain protein [Corynebacterium capitovis DSM 44611]|uniref:LysR family transcriptional regulator substrate-binding protein n=1 Tax=Corynebacterium capitovis TaxID=131081 RepID=UPI0003791FE8|nr:LysR family transcriptional regulator substrate-binding protein [Corynebacterium capitovis]WKD57940.1 LysR substrate binding domain protein [Corynebacterium capitovis DSM 44611]
MLTLFFATGTEPGKWLRRYEEGTRHGLAASGADDPLAGLLAGECDLALVRLPDPRVGPEYHVVILYDEAPGIAVPRESDYASVYAGTGEAVTEDDVALEPVNFVYREGANLDDLRTALQVVAANVGVAFAPIPLLRALSKKQVTVLRVAHAGVEPTRVGLVWRRDHDSNAIQDFVGVAKGRSVRSSRSSQGSASPKQGVATRRRKR